MPCYSHWLPRRIRTASYRWQWRHLLHRPRTSACTTGHTSAGCLELSSIGHLAGDDSLDWVPSRHRNRVRLESRATSLDERGDALRKQKFGGGGSDVTIIGQGTW